MSKSPAKDSTPLKPWEYATSGVASLLLSGPLGAPFGVGSLYLWNKASRKNRWTLWALTGLFAAPIAIVAQTALIDTVLDIAGSPPKTTEVAEAPAPEAEPEPEVDHMNLAKQRGYAAATAAQTANTEEQWDVVLESWSKAIEHLRLEMQTNPDNAEAKAKDAEYRANREVARERQRALAPQRVSAPRSLNDVEQFNSRIREIDPSGTLVTGAERLTDDSDILKVAITTNFLRQNKEVQREMAAGIQRIWAQVHSPTEPDKASIYLVTGSGQHIGGSRMWGGTMIYIKD